MQEIKEKELLDLIKSGNKIAVKMWMDNCPYCDEYAPIFKAVSEKVGGFKYVSFNMPPVSDSGAEFKRNYMKPKAGEKMGAPCTYVFEGGQMKKRKFGKMSEAELEAFLTETPEIKFQKLQNERLNLLAQKGEILHVYEKLPVVNKRLEQVEAELMGGM
jgi:thiol-disulfide isomerase/thioredoxin